MARSVNKAKKKARKIQFEELVRLSIEHGLFHWLEEPCDSTPDDEFLLDEFMEEARCFDYIPSMAYLLDAADKLKNTARRATVWSIIHAFLWRYIRGAKRHSWRPVPKLSLRSDRLEVEAFANAHKLSWLLDWSLIDLSFELDVFDEDFYECEHEGGGPFVTWRIGDLIAPSYLWTVCGEPPRRMRSFLLTTLREQAKNPHYIASAEQPPPLREDLEPLAAKLPDGSRSFAEQLIDAIARMDEVGMVPSGDALVLPMLGLDVSRERLVYAPIDTAGCDSNDYGMGLFGMFADNHIFCSLASPVELICTCEYSRRGEPCPGKMRAGMDMLEALAQNPELVADVERITSVPAWRRRVDELLTTDLASPVLSGELDGAPAWFGWRVESRNTILSVRPCLVREKKRMSGVITKPLSASITAEELEDELQDPDDIVLLQRWSLAEHDAICHEFPFHFPSNSRRYSASRATRRLLMNMSGAANLYWHEKKSVALEVIIEHASIIIDELPDGRIDVGVYFETERCAPDLLERYSAQPSRIVDCYVRADADGATMTLRVLPETVRARLEEQKLLFESPLPVETRAEIVTAAPTLVLDPSIQLTEGMRGVSVTPSDAMTLTLAIREAGLRVKVMVTPLADAVSCVPGEGPELLFAPGEGGTVHVAREFDAELARATALLESIGVPSILEQSTAYLDNMDDAMDVIAAIQALEQPDVEVVWDTARRHVNESLSSDQLDLTIESRRGHMFAIGGQIERDDVAIPLSQLLAAARQRKSWIEIVPNHWSKMTDSLATALEKLAGFGDVDEEMPVVSALATPALLELEENLGVTWSGPKQWATLREQVELARETIPVLSGDFTGELRSYQRAGFEWLSRLAMWAPGACLADDMGLGKTIQALALLLERAPLGPCLIIGPTSLGFNWQREARKFAPTLKFSLIRKTADIDDAAPGAFDVMYMSYDLAARNVDWAGARTWATLVLDEAQAIKNADTQRARAIHQLDAEFSLALTGTPLENHTGELWSLMRVVAPGLLGSRAEFRRKFQIPIEHHQDATRRAGLAAAISPFVLRRLKREVALDLPERADVRLDIELSAKERGAYETFRRAALASLASGTEDKRKRFELLAAITRLRQLACHSRLVDPAAPARSSKVEVLIEKLLDVHEEGHRALVFSQFTSLLDMIAEALEETPLRVAILTGKTSAARRAKLVDAFQAGEYDVFLLSIKAGGVGLNLTRASFVFHIDPWWNPAVEDQATDRVHRIGQTEPVTVYRLIALGTIEETIYELHETKRELLDAVLQGADSARPLSIDELQQLLDSQQSYEPGEVIDMPSPTKKSRVTASLQRAESKSHSTKAPAKTTRGAAKRQAVTKKSTKKSVSAASASKSSSSRVVSARADHLTIEYLTELVEAGELGAASSRTYRRSIGRILDFLLSLDAAPEDLAEAYRAAADSGDITATKNDYKNARTFAKHALVIANRADS